MATTAPSSLVNPPSQTQAAIQSPSRTGSSILELVRSVMPTHKTSSASLRWRTAMRSRAALIGSAAAGGLILLGLLIWALSGGEGTAQTQPTRGWANQALGPVARVSMPAVLLRAGDWQEAGDVPLSATSSFMVLVEEMTWPGGQVSGGGEGPRSATAPAKLPGTLPGTLPGALPGAVVVKARNVTDQVVVGSVLELVMWTPAPTSLAKAVSRMDLPVLLPRESLTVRVSMPEGLATAGSTLTGRFVGGEAWSAGVALGMGQVRVMGQSGGEVDHVALEVEPAQGRAVQEVAFELAARDKDDRVVGRWGVTGRLTREAGEAAVVEVKLPAPVIKADDVRWQAAGVGRPAPERVSKP
ncbi:MAG: hypothetical protein IT442_03590 [Phycisphaeraceae bacterium]|nr:hypothetical protein [Phycisphaeraceae bacterium]